jgi:hypothetical protein
MSGELEMDKNKNGASLLSQIMKSLRRCLISCMN